MKIEKRENNGLDQREGGGKEIQRKMRLPTKRGEREVTVVEDKSNKTERG